MKDDQNENKNKEIDKISSNGESAVGAMRAWGRRGGKKYPTFLKIYARYFTLILYTYIIYISIVRFLVQYWKGCQVMYDV